MAIAETLSVVLRAKDSFKTLLTKDLGVFDWRARGWSSSGGRTRVRPSE